MSNTPRKSGFSPRPFVVIGYVVIFVAFGILGGWAATAPLASAVIASGTVSVESNRKTIQHFEGGIVEQILVQEAQHVETGDVLVRLIPLQAEANRGMVRSRYTIAKASEARLLAERNNIAAIDFPGDLAARSDPATQLILQNQRALFDDRRQVRDGQISILDTRIEQLEREIDGLLLTQEATGLEMKFMEEEVERLRDGLKRGVVAQNRLAATERQRAQLQGQLGRVTSELAKTRKAIGETELQIVQLGQEFRERAVTELKTVRDELTELEERLIVADDVLERTQIRAPITGIVQNIQVHTEGGVIRTGEPIMEIVPVADDLIINAQVQPLDIDSITSGLQAEVRFPAFPSRNLDVVFGRIESISPDIIINEQQQTSYYLTRIVVDESQVPENIAGRIVPGMPADIIIATGERTVIDYLVAPLSDAITRSMREE